MAFRLGNRSLTRLEGVHPDLVDVVKRAIELTPYDFGVSEGVRDIATQRKYVNQGKSTTMHSRHLVQDDGYSHAVDIHIYVDGQVSWEHKHFRKVIQAFFTAAIELNVQIESGGLWQDFQDDPHFQLNPEYY